MASYNPNPPPSTASATSSFLTIPHDIPSNPILLTAQDILTVLFLSPLLPNMIYPLHPLASPLDELYPTYRNLRDLCLQIILLSSQISLLLSFPFAFITLWAIPCLVHAVFYISFGIVTSLITWILNERPKWQGNRHDSLIGRPEGREAVNDTGISKEGEVWFFINGIATGKGLLLDIAECLIQRDLNYTTHATRVGRAQLHSALSSEHTKKVVLIAHSQGGIIASAILDWLHAELGDEELRKLEVYTFASAGRVLRNPSRTKNGSKKEGKKGRALGSSNSSGSSHMTTNYIHNQHSHQNPPFNHFHGPVFIREGSGHLLNMHYLDTMFSEESGFMDKLIDLPMDGGIVQRPLGDLSRLWKYRGGGSPDDGEYGHGDGDKNKVDFKGPEGRGKDVFRVTTNWYKITPAKQLAKYTS
ncbi:hypothetical protein AN6319.2 [Aspergillus nidulans FGSC A4]|nr:hypothetical protein AN6319.2 [Aspergillus nidulans FGSC A4]|eukprot:XP_663923.1 hypothetical protein AN6319.2 [Aspergillus nidulans FGSC A4]